MKTGGVEDDQLAVLKTVVKLAHSLDIPVVAEGIETASQLMMCQAMSCDRGQGFHFAKPLTSTDAERLVSGSNLLKPNAA